MYLEGGETAKGHDLADKSLANGISSSAGFRAKLSAPRHFYSIRPEHKVAFPQISEWIFR